MTGLTSLGQRRLNKRVKPAKYELVKFRMQRRKYLPFPQKIREVEGFDVETTKDGHARIIASSTEWCSVGNLHDAIAFMTSKQFNDKINMSWNLTFDINTILKLHKPTLVKVMNEGSAKFEGHLLEWTPEKAFKIKRGHHTTSFFDALQYYHSELAFASKQFLGVEPHPLKAERENLFGKYSDQEIGEYCIDDALKTKQLTEYYLKMLFECGVIVKYPFSLPNIMQEHILRLGNGIIPPNVTPYEILKKYWQAYRGGWIDTYKRGVFNDAKVFDLNSAYPAAMVRLPDLRDGIWEDSLVKESDLGVVVCEVKGGLEAFAPISVRHYGQNIYPDFDEPTKVFLTLREFKAFSKNYKITPLEAHSFIPNDDARYPFRDEILRLWKIKNEGRFGTLKTTTIKQMINSLSGKFRELNNNDEMGKLFLPVYMSEVTAFTRVKLFEAAKKYANRIIWVNTDAVMFDGNVKLDCGEGLGEFVEKNKGINGECLVIRAGVYQFKGASAVLRGVTSKLDLFSVCNTPEEEITTYTIKPYVARRSLKGEDIRRIGVFANVPQKIRLNSEQKRLWGRPILANELLSNKFESAIIPMSELI